MRLNLIVPFLWLAAFASAASAQQSQPNIVFFLVDDMGWQETSVPFHTAITELNKRYRTPNMERLAADGMKFTQAYASAVCSPTRVSLLTGMNAARHRVTNWTLRKDRSPDNPHPLVEPPRWNLNGVAAAAGIDRAMRITPLPALLRDSGYRTIHVGKAHFGAQDTPGENPLHLGFDINIAGHAAGAPGSYYGEKNFSGQDDRIWDVPGLTAYHGKKINLTEALTLEAIRAMEQAVAVKKPFYLYMSHYAVHAPWEKDDRFYGHYIEQGLSPFEATLASMIESMDKSLGDLMATLERLGIERNTIILFLSDNGSPSNCPRNLPLRGHKITPYEGGVRVPMIVKWPDVVRPGTVNRNPVIVEDFFPTILAMAGAKRKTLQPVDGVSFVQRLKGNGKPSAQRAFVWHFPHFYGRQEPYSALRQGPWKLIYHHAQRKLELFNLDEDIGEERDLSSMRPDKMRALTALLGAQLRAEGAQMPTDKTTGKTVEWPDRLPARHANRPDQPASRQQSANPQAGGQRMVSHVLKIDLPPGTGSLSGQATSVGRRPDVWLFGGQSNMQGIAQLADLPPGVPKSIPNAWFWNEVQFERMVLGQTKLSGRAGEFGPEVGFALHMAQSENPNYLIKYYASGMPLHHGWNGDVWLGGAPHPGRRNFYPGEKPGDPNTGTLYLEMRDRFQAAVRQLEREGYRPVIRGFLWMQGEQDAKREESATTYAANLKRLQERLAADLNTLSPLPLVFGQALPYEPAAARFTHRQELRAQMAAADGNSRQPEAIRYARMVATDGFGLLPDTVHFNADGQLRLGIGMAEAMKALQAAIDRTGVPQTRRRPAAQRVPASRPTRSGKPKLFK